MKKANGLFFIKQGSKKKISHDDLTELAKNGDGEALFLLGFEALYYGNHTEAFRYFELSGKAGYDEAISGLAWLYYTGLGVDQDLKKAFELASHAAYDLDVAEAFSLLGSMYLGGKVCTIDEKRGIDLLKIGFMKGDVSFAQLLGKISIGFLTVYPIDYHMAIYYFEVAYDECQCNESVPYLCDLYYGRYSKDVKDKVKYMKWKKIFDKLSPDDYNRNAL